MKSISPFFKIFRNKYVVSATLFIIWMSFFDPKDWSLISNRKDKLEELEKSEKQLTKQIIDTRKELSLLKTNAETIEKYAREKYLMKKDNEDLFIVNSP